MELIGDAGFRVDDAAVYKGLKQTQWEGRLEILQRSPMLLVDGAHNPAGVATLCRALQNDFPHRRLILVFGVLGDKDYRTMARRLFPLADRVILTRPHSERALPPDSLRPLAEKFNRDIEVVEDPGRCAEARPFACREGGSRLCGRLSLSGGRNQEAPSDHRKAAKRVSVSGRPVDRSGVERC